MHAERLRQLNDLLPLIEASAAKWHAAADDADALVRSTKAAIAKETRERRHLRGLTFMPAALGVGVAVKAWSAAHRTTTSMAGGLTVGVAASAIGFAALCPPGADPPPNRPSLAEPAPPLPPIGHNPPRQGPPKGHPPHYATPPPAAAPIPTGTLPPIPPIPSPTVPPIPSPLPVPSPTVAPPANGEPGGDEPTCRIYLRHILGRGLLCGRSARYP